MDQAHAGLGSRHHRVDAQKFIRRVAFQAFGTNGAQGRREARREARIGAASGEFTFRLEAGGGRRRRVELEQLGRSLAGAGPVPLAETISIASSLGLSTRRLVLLPTLQRGEISARGSRHAARRCTDQGAAAAATQVL
jgi:hypothetical protein